ncbi:MAG: transcriptional regulator, MerR family [Chthonomonadaceae bacterium]|nr:transcriptional regulator, MerR family [Chthonomonadaceae bacterium]
MTVRTLRFYDKVGLLAPSATTDAGYRLYAEQDLLTLQHILALKFLGFSLEEIKQCLCSGPTKVEEMLARQRQMMQAKRRQLDAILSAIGSAEKLVSAGHCGPEAIIRVIMVIQMQEKREWVKKYFSHEQIQKMDALNTASYSEEAREKLAAREWTEADQERANAQWAHVASESKRLAEAGADPAGEEGQALAKFKSDLLLAFTQGDPEITAGLGKFWENHNAPATGEQPLAEVVPPSVVPGANDVGAQFLARAMTLY